MPIYEYECRACGAEHEILQKIIARPLRKCPSCGALRLHRKVSRSAFHLKGEGWYVTDYASNGKKKEKEESASKTESAGEKKPGPGKAEGAGEKKSGPDKAETQASD